MLPAPALALALALLPLTTFAPPAGGGGKAGKPAGNAARAGAAGGGGAAKSSAPTAGWADQQKALLDGVKRVARPGVPGTLALWREEAIPLVLDEGARGGVVAAAAPMGRGRVVLLTQGYLGKEALESWDTRALIANAVKWCAKSARTPVVGYSGDRVPEPLASAGIGARALGKQWWTALEGVDVLLLADASYPDAGVDAVRAFVERGGGAIACMCPWGVAQVRRQPVEATPMARTFESCGIAFTGGYAAGDSKDGFEVVAPDAYSNGALALRALERAKSGEKLDDASMRVALRAAVSAAVEVPDSQAQAAALRSHPFPAVGKMQGTDEFPGRARADARTVVRTLAVDRAVTRWHSTGVYANPGSTITVKIPENAGAAAEGLRLRIGAHTDGLWHHKEWRRVPEISMERALAPGVTKLTTPFGGLVYIEVPEHGSVKRPATRRGAGGGGADASADAGSVEVRIEGGYDAPWFVLGKTDPAEWRDRIRKSPAPWAELQSDRVILTVPSESVRGIEDPTQLMQFWNSLVDAASDLRGWERERAWPWRYATDIQISAGYMHSGYPIMTHLDAAKPMTQLDELRTGQWGPFHELGHNHQNELWTFEGTGEVTCNLWSIYLLEKCCGTTWKPGDAGVKERADDFAAYLKKGRDFEHWKREPFLALQMYEQLKNGFGWEIFTRLFREYDALPAAERPKSQEERRDAWMVRFSRAAGRNLGPFFEAWGVPTSAAARASIADLPAWMPPGFPPADAPAATAPATPPAADGQRSR
ncbi:MAG: M60 family metallopeptidase [Phycisphaerales bacterium]